MNLLFCNAGLIEAEEGGSLDDMVRAIPAIREEFETNAMGPLRTVHALNSNLKPLLIYQQYPIPSIQTLRLCF